MDALKKYLQDNLDKLNNHEPNEDVLSKIFNEITIDNCELKTIINNQIHSFEQHEPTKELFENIWDGLQKDTLKENIQNNIEAFYLQEPKPESFEKIMLAMPLQKSRGKIFKMPTFLKYAAAACVGGVIMFVIGKGFYKSDFPKEEVLTAIDNKKIETIKNADIKPIEESLIAENKAPKINTQVKDIVFSLENKENILAANNGNKKQIETPENEVKKLNKIKINKTLQNEVINFNNAKAVKLVEDFSANYSPLLALQVKKIESIPLQAEGPEYYQSFKYQWQELDNDEKVFKAQIKKFGLTDVGFQPLMNIYQSKLNLLNSLQTEINKTNNKYQKNRSAVDSINTKKYITL